MGPNDNLEVEEEFDPEARGFELEREVEGVAQVGGEGVEVDHQAQLDFEPGEGIEGGRITELEAEGEGPQGEDWEIEQDTTGTLDTTEEGALVYDQDTVVDRDGLAEEQAVLGEPEAEVLPPADPMMEDEEAVLGDEDMREFEADPIDEEPLPEDDQAVLGDDDMREFEADPIDEPADDMAVADDVTFEDEADIAADEPMAESDSALSESEKSQKSETSKKSKDQASADTEEDIDIDVDAEADADADEFAAAEPELADDQAWEGEGAAMDETEPAPAEDDLAMDDSQLADETDPEGGVIVEREVVIIAPVEEPDAVATADELDDADLDSDEIDVFDDQDDTAVLGDEDMRTETEVEDLSLPQDRDPVVFVDEDPYAVEPVEPIAETDPYLASGVGMGFLVGGGVNGYVGEADNFTGTGGNWEARYIAGTRTIIGGELAYHGTANQMDTLGVDDNAVLMSNGAEGALRVNLLTEEWQPYVVGGVGWKHFNVTNTDTNTSDIRDSDDALTVPVGAGLAYRFDNIVADVRGMYRPAFLADITRSGGEDDTNLDTINGSLNIGFEF